MPDSICAIITHVISTLAVRNLTMYIIYDGWWEGGRDGWREGGMNGWKDGLVYVLMFEASPFRAS